MKLKKALILCSILAAAAAMQTGASAATQVGGTYNYTGTSDLPNANDNSKISPYMDDKWTIPTSNTRGVMTGQKTKINDGTTNDGGDFGKCFTGAANHYSFRSDLNAKIVYYTFDLMASDGGFGSVAINGHRLDGNSYNWNGSKVDGVDIAKANNVKYNPHRITVIADTLNNKAYYYSAAMTGEEEKANIALGSEATQLDIGNRYDNNTNRYFFKNFAYGTIDYAVNGADTVTAGGSSSYTIAETGDSLGVDYKPANVTYTLASAVDGISISESDGTLTAANTVANNTEVTINANINDTKVASKTVTISNPPAAEPTVSTEKLSSTTGDDGSVADVFYAAFNANGSSANKVNVTVNETTQSITTANMSGEGSVCFGIVISYSDGDNKGYTPTFTFE